MIATIGIRELPSFQKFDASCVRVEKTFRTPTLITGTQQPLSLVLSESLLSATRQCSVVMAIQKAIELPKISVLANLVFYVRGRLVTIQRIS